MKQLTIILGILLAVLGCADNKKDGPATLDDGSSKRMTELDSLSKISIIKDTTVWPGFNLINRQGSRVGVWKETDNSTYTELEYFKGGKETIQKIYSRKTGSLEIFVHDIEDNFGDIYYSFDFKSIVVQCSNFRLNNREFIGRMPNRNRYKYRCIIIGFFSNGAVSSIGDMEYYESPMCDGEDLWMRYFKEDGTESDVDLYDYKKRRGRDLNNLDSCGRVRGCGWRMTATGRSTTRTVSWTEYSAHTLERQARSSRSDGTARGCFPDAGSILTSRASCSESMTIPTLKEVPAGWPTHISQNKKCQDNLTLTLDY